MKRPTVPRAARVTLNRDYTRGDDLLSEYVMDVSQSGAFIRTNDPLPVGTRLQVRFSVTVDRMELVEGLAEVVRVSAAPSGMGVFFVELTESSQDVLARLIDQRRTIEAPTGSEGEGTLRTGRRP